MAQARGSVVGFVDADDKTPIEELDKLLPWLEQGYDVVIGSRGLAESRIEVAQRWYRRLGSRAFGVLMHLVMGLPHVRDTQCGFKFFRGPVARDLFARQRIDGYMFDIEILHLAARSGYRVKEVGRALARRRRQPPRPGRRQRAQPGRPPAHPLRPLSRRRRAAAVAERTAHSS